MSWQIARWWALVNTVGALITMIALEMNYSWHVQRHDFNPRPPSYATAFLIQLLILILLGLLQVALGCSLIALNRSRRKVFQIMLGVAVGVLTTLVIPSLGTLVISVLAIASFFTLFPSGILFGTIAGISRWRSVIRTDEKC